MLREMWLNIGVKKTDMHKGITVKALLDSDITGMFMDRKIAAKYGFKLQKLERPVVVRNVDETNNSTGAITHQVEVNMYYKNHVERIRMNVYNLEKTDVILEMLWLQAYNLEINWEMGEVKIMRYLPLNRRKIEKREDKRAKKRKRVATPEEEKIIKWVVDNKED